MENQKAVRILFMILNSKTLKNKEKAPLYCRLTINKDQKRFSTGINVPFDLWGQELQRVKGKTDDAVKANRKINDLIRNIEVIETAFEKADKNFNVGDLLNKLLGRETAPFRTLMQVYEYKYAQMKKLEGKEYKASTVAKSIQLQKPVKKFLKHAYGVNDISLSKIDIQFLNEFEFYLKSDLSMAVATYNKIIQKLKAMMKLAFDYGAIQKNAFPSHKFKHERPKVIFLEIDELKKLETHKFGQPRLTMIRDLFLFSVYTGLHYIDAMSLTDKNIIVGVDGKKWICYTRQKTDVEIQIPILEKTQLLINSFKDNYNTGFNILPRFSNQKINSYLKEIAEITGIQKHLSHKVARKTFGSVLLYYNVPMKVVSKLMGHSSIIITERHYAQVELKKLGLEMDKVAQQIQ